MTIDEIRARLAKATPWPWRRNGKHGVVTSQSHPLCDVSDPFHRQTQAGTGEDEDFIAHAPADIAFLLSRVEELTKREDWAVGCIAAAAERDGYKSRVAAAEAESSRLRAALEEIESLCDEEIKWRFGTISEAQVSKSAIYTLLAVPRNMAAAALRPARQDTKEGA